MLVYNMRLSSKMNCEITEIKTRKSKTGQTIEVHLKKDYYGDVIESTIYVDGVKTEETTPQYKSRYTTYGKLKSTTVWHRNGNCNTYTRFNGGMSNVEKYNEDGLLIEKYQMNSLGQCVGEYLKLYNDNLYKLRCNYDKNGCLIGSYKSWYPNGKLMTHRKYKSGGEIIWSQDWYLDGRLSRDFNVYKDVICTEYDKTGVITLIRYKNREKKLNISDDGCNVLWEYQDTIVTRAFRNGEWYTSVLPA